MTQQVRHPQRCKRCRGVLVCRDCAMQSTHGTPFGDWLRQLAAPLDSSYVSNQNLDYIWHNYRENWLITIEEKQDGNGRVNFAQEDTHQIVAQMIGMAARVMRTDAKEFVLNKRGGMIKVAYRGHYKIVFSNTSPRDSEYMTINGKPATCEELMMLLRTGELEPNLN